jgi:uncharacterized protein
MWGEAGNDGQQVARLATIVDLYGDELAQINAPVDGMIFDLRSLNTVQMGDWCCFFAEIEGEIQELARADK